MRKGMNTLLVAWAFLSVSIQAQAPEGDYLTVDIPALEGDSTTIQVTARNPDERKRMGTIAVTIDGGGPVISENTRIYDLFPPGGAGNDQKPIARPASFFRKDGAPTAFRFAVPSDNRGACFSGTISRPRAIFGRP